MENKLRVPSVDEGRIGRVQHVERGGEKSFAIHVGNVRIESGVAPHTRGKGGAMYGVSGGSAFFSSIRCKDGMIIITSVSHEVKRSNNMARGISDNGRGGWFRRKGTTRRVWGDREK